MTDIQQKLLELLSEIKEICQNLDCKFSLASTTAEKAIKYGGFIKEEIDAEIWMPERDFLKFRQHIPKERVLEGIDTNPQFPGTYYLYSSKDTLVCDLNHISCMKEHGIAIMIHVLRERIHSRVLRRINFYAKELIEAPYISNEIISKESAAERLRRCLLIVFQKVTYGKVAAKFYEWTRQTKFWEETNNYYVEQFLKRPFSFPKEWFEQPEYTELEGISFPIPQNEEKILSKTKWKIGPIVRQRGHVAVVDTRIGYEVYFKRLEENKLISKSFLRRRKKYLFAVDTRLKPLQQEIQNKWDLLFMTGERYRLWKKYIPVKEEIFQMYDEDQKEDLEEILEEYLTILMQYEKKKYAVCFDPDIWKIALEILKERGLEKNVKHLESYVFPEHLEKMQL